MRSQEVGKVVAVAAAAAAGGGVGMKECVCA